MSGDRQWEWPLPTMTRAISRTCSSIRDQENCSRLAENSTWREVQKRLEEGCPTAGLALHPRTTECPGGMGATRGCDGGLGAGSAGA